MSRFICPEADGAFTPDQAAEAVIRWVFQQRVNETLDRFSNTDGEYTKLMDKFDLQKNYQQSFFLKSEAYPFMGRIPKTSTARTVAELATAMGLTITLSEADTGVFAWFAENVFDLFQTPYWITIYKEDGIILALPVKNNSGYKGKLTDAMILRRIAYYGSAGYDGETGFDYTIAADTSIVAPGTIDDGYKDQVINKHLAMRNVIWFQASELNIDADPLDWLLGPDGNVYVIVSRKQDVDDPNIVYTAVQEYDEARSYSGGDVIPIMLVKDVSLPSMVKANRSTVQSIAFNTLVKVQYNNVDNNAMSEYDSTMFKFTAKYTGWRNVHAQILFDIGEWAAGNYADLLIIKNGVTRYYGTRKYVYATLTHFLAIEVTDDVYLEKGEYIEIYAVNVRTAGALNLYASASFNRLSIHSIN